jgi:hypothetical protein
MKKKKSMEHLCNDTGKGKREYMEKNVSQCHFVHHKPTYTGPESNPCLPAETPATNSLFQVTVLLKDKADISNLYINVAPTSQTTQIIPIMQIEQLMEIQKNCLIFIL